MKKIPKYDSAVLQWIDKNGFKNSRGQPFEWYKHAFLIDIMCDWSQKQVHRKSAQVGESECMNMKAMFALEAYGLNIIYTNPKHSSSQNMVATKVNPIIERNPQLSSKINGTIDYKEIDGNFIFYRGTFSSETKDKRADTDAGISITSDLNIYDERDRSDQYVIGQYTSRLENSDYAGEWSLSNPSYPGVGTDYLYEEKSDRKMWYIKCSHCNHQQYMDWVKYGEHPDGILDHCLIHPIDKIFICGKCHGQITDTDRMRGEWVATYENRDFSGYWISQLIYPHHSAFSLLEKEARPDMDKQHFYNMVLGKPYRGTDVTVDRSSILKNLFPTVNEKKDVFMGVDQGVNKHYVIGNDTGIFEMGETKDWDYIERLLVKYNATCVIDAMPYPNPVRKLVKKYSGSSGPKVYMCYYDKDSNKSQVVTWKRNEVHVQRTQMFDVVVDKFTQGEMPIQIPERDLTDYVKHWDTLSRLDIKDEKTGIIKPQWVSSNNEDHYCHATLYMEVAKLKRKGDSKVEKFRKEPPKLLGDTFKNFSIEKLTRKRNTADWRYTN